MADNKMAAWIKRVEAPKKGKENARL